MIVRAAGPDDAGAIWRILEPTIRAGETYPLPRDLSERDALAYWFNPDHAVFVAEDDGRIVGTYYLRANTTGAGAHVANCGYMTAPAARGRGVARAKHQGDQLVRLLVDLPEKPDPDLKAALERWARAKTA